jgi:large subunit ribosomal protein L4
MAVNTFTKSGAKSATAAKLPNSVFAVEINNHQLLKDAYLAYSANGRINLAKTLKRGEVRGGGAKPWRQKGTGRARVGSSRNPIWTGGGVTFGPSGNENYSRKISTQANRKALAQALTLAAKNGSIIVLDTFETKGKVKDTAVLLKKINATRRVLIVVSVLDDLVRKATSNLPQVNAVFAMDLNVYDVLNADTIVISKKSLDIIEAWLGGKK